MTKAVLLTEMDQGQYLINFFRCIVRRHDTLHYEFQHNDTQRNDTQHNNTRIPTFSIPINKTRHSP
jgi:hypothetical protein